MWVSFDEFFCSFLVTIECTTNVYFWSVSFWCGSGPWIRILYPSLKKGSGSSSYTFLDDVLIFFRNEIFSFCSHIFCCNLTNHSETRKFFIISLMLTDLCFESNKFILKGTVSVISSDSSWYINKELSLLDELNCQRNGSGLSFKQALLIFYPLDPQVFADLDSGSRRLKLLRILSTI